jgi:hypothetical protein
MIARLGWVPNLDGTAIAYDRQADRLVEGSQFRTDLSLNQTARALKISPSSIANPRSPDEVDPDAELFRAQSGVLTPRSKESVRRFQRQLAAGKVADSIVQEWVITELSFTLKRLKQPSDQEEAVLSAIARAASQIMPDPDDKVRAVGVAQHALETGHVVLTPGMLPPSIPTTDHGRDEGVQCSTRTLRGAISPQVDDERSRTPPRHPRHLRRSLTRASPAVLTRGRAAGFVSRPPTRPADRNATSPADGLQVNAVRGFPSSRGIASTSTRP